MNKVFLGIDVGSVSINVVVIDDEYKVILKQYIRSNGQPLESTKQYIQNRSLFLNFY